jgi:hypothetical protein
MMQLSKLRLPLPPAPHAIKCSTNPTTLLHSRGRGLRSIHSKLNEDNCILDHSPQTPNQPRQIRVQVILLQRMAQNASSIRGIPHQREQKEE